MARVLISMLGTGRLDRDKKSERVYLPTEYQIDGKKYMSSFIAAVLARHLKVDKIIFVGTAKSMWEEIYREFAVENLNEDYYLELAVKIDHSNHASADITEANLEPIEQVLDARLGTTGSKCLIIKYGLDEEELWYNFDKFLEISDLLEHGDEVFLDITHSFRSLSLFNYLMLNFTESLAEKQIRVAGLFYGMLDVRNELNYAPIVDLKGLFALSQWIKAIHNFKNYGNGYLAADLIRENNKELAQKVDTFSDVANLNYLGAIKQQLDSLQKLLQKVELKELGGPVKYVGGYLRGFLERFVGIKEHSFFQLEIAKWHFENKRYATCYLTMHESIVTRLCEVRGIDWQNFNNRKDMKDHLREYNPKSGVTMVALKKKYQAITKIRNKIAHSLTESDMATFRNDINNISKYYNELKSIFAKISFD